ncbi:MAG TPA: cyclic nucleotide-binding domain-containing protein [Polyangiaceae bacterium]
MSPSHEASPASVARSPLDLAISATIDGEYEVALRQAGAILEQDPTRAVAALVIGKCLGELSFVEPACLALRLAVRLSVREGFLPRAVAAAIELSKFGAKTEEVLSNLARIFARGSTRLVQQGAAPPALTRPRLSAVPLQHGLKGNGLISYVAGLIKGIEKGLESADDERPLPRQPLLSALEEAGLTQTLNAFDLVWVNAGTTIVEQAQPGEEAYILARGEIQVTRKDESGADLVLARLGSGALFGEMALLSRAPRAASVVACRASLLLVAKKEALDEVVAAVPDVGAVLADYCRHRMIDNLVRTSKILSRVQPVERVALMQRFVTRSFETGERLIGQGQDAEGLHLIASGEVAVIRDDGGERTLLATLRVGDVVGEMALVLRKPSTANVVATAPTVTLHLPHGEFMGIVRRYPEVLSHLYELAVERDAMTTSIVAQEATDADEFVLL